MALVFTLESGALPLSAQVVGFRGTEALTRPYVLDIYIVVPGVTELEPAAVVGLPATLLIRNSRDAVALALGAQPDVTYSGILARFQMVRATATSTLYRATLVPKLWQLGLTKHSRVWTKMSIPDILKAVLAQEGVANFEFRLTGVYSPEEHVCQYRESSLDFIHRWMEREGLYYFFEQNGGEETLVVVDSLAAHTTTLHGPVRYHPSEDETAGRHFDNFVTGASSLPATVRLSDYDYANPSVPVMGMSPVWPTGFGEVSESASDARVFNSGDGSRIAKVRAEALRSEGEQAHATGSALGLSPGYKFALEQHPRPTLDKEYLVVRQKIVGRFPEQARGWRIAELEGGNQILSVEVAAISADLQYREPRRTPWPRVDGYENGVVDGPAESQYAQIDSMGRYEVKMKFDEGPLSGGQASTWVRMMQPHAGAPEGMHFPLRKGTEVVFLFLGGDPDRPVIAGAIPNAVTPSPVTSANNTKNVLQTGARNRLELEDQKGSEWVKLSTPGDQTHLFMGKPGEGGDHSFVLETQKDGEVHTGTNLDLKVDQKWDVKVKDTLTEDVQNDVTEKYHANHKQTVDSKQTIKISGGHEETIDSGAKQTISGGHQQSISGGFTRSVNGDYTNSLQGSHTQSHNGAHQHLHSGVHQHIHSGSHQHMQAGPLSRTRAGATTETLVGAVTRNVVGELSETITANVDWTVSANVGTKCVDWSVKSTTAESIQGTSFTVKAGSASLTMQSGMIILDNGAGATISLVGAMAIVDGPAGVTVTTGSTMALNSGTLTSNSGGPQTLTAGGDISGHAPEIHWNG